MIRKAFSFSFIYGLIIFQSISILPSIIYIESGIYINEQARNSFFSWATIITCIYFIVTFSVIFLTHRKLNMYKIKSFVFTYQGKNVESVILRWAVIIVMSILLFNALQSPLPFFDKSLSRFTYWSNSKYPFLSSVFGNTATFIPFILGILFFKHKKFSITILLIYFMYNFLIGQKFSPILNGSFSFFLPIVVIYSREIKKLIKKNFIKIVLLFSLSSIFIYYVIYEKYSATYPFANIKIYDPNEAIFYRVFGLQGHLMWGSTERFIFDNKSPHSYNPMELLYGMPEMMSEFAGDSQVLDNNANMGFNFTNAYPGILIKIFPVPIALLTHILFSIVLLGFCGWILKKFIRQNAKILAVITFQLFFWIIYAFTMGYFYKVIFFILFIIVYFTFLNLTKNNKIENH